MGRIAVTLAACAALLGSVVAARAAEPLNVPAPVAARLAACDMMGAERSAVFVARMDALPDAARMAVRFQVFEKLGRGADWEKIDVPALRQWHRSAPGVQTFSYRQTVDALRAGGAYKARVTFRWTTAGGNTLDSETRETPVCRGPLPDLAASLLEVRPGPTADTRNYRVTIANDGKGDADDVEVALSVDRAVLDTQTIDKLDAGDDATLTFTGPACTYWIRVRVDPDNNIGELHEADRTQLFACPTQS